MKELIEFKLTPYQVALALVFIALPLRLFNIEVTGLWMDEIHSTVGTDPDKTITDVLEYCKTDQPPVFFLLLHGWFKVFPFSDLSGRVFALIAGLLGVLAMYHLGKEFKDYRIGLVAAFLTTINYFHIDHSRQIRFYPLVFLFSALSYYFFLRIFKRKKPVDFICYALATGALLNTHYFGMVVFVSQFLLFIFIILWQKIRDFRFIGYCLLSGIAAALTFAHWIPVIFSDLTIPEFHIPPLKWFFLAQYFVFYFRDYLTATICAVLVYLALRKIVQRARARALQIEDVILVGWIGLGFIIPVLYSVIRMPMLEYKYSFIVVPAVLLLVAFGIDSIPNPKLKLPLLIGLAVIFLFNATFFKNSLYYRIPTEQWRETTQRIVETDSDTQYVFSDYAWYYRYYFKINKSINPPLEPMYADFNALLNNANQVWILTSKRFYNNGLNASQKQALDQDFEFVKQLEFVDVTAKCYVRR